MTSSAPAARTRGASVSTPTSGAVTQTAPSTRLTALDGLRGVAAIIVVFHHLYLVAEPILRQQGGSGVGSPLWWVSQTPLKLVSAGTQAVLIFFVLSGLVVALPALKPSNFSWAGFLSGRVARLYIPAWASLLMGTIVIWILPRDPSAVTPGSWMDKSQATSTGWGSLVAEMSLTNDSYDLNNVLWSLRWELVFSVLLPLFVGLAIVVSRYWVIALAAVIAVSTAGLLADVDALRYLPVFFIGTLMAVRLNVIREWGENYRRGRMPGLTGGLIAIGSLVLLIAEWLFRPIFPAGTLVNLLLGQLSVLGASGMVLAAITVRHNRRLLETRPMQWLGKVSFSLYLVHMPILATLTFLFGDVRWWLVTIITVPLSLVAAWGFFVGIERPSQRLARRISRAVTIRLERHRAGLRHPGDVSG